MYTIAFYMLVELISSSLAQNATITSGPVAQNVTEGTTVNFRCTGQGILFRWIINGELDNSKGALSREINIIESTLNQNLIESNLTINGALTNNNITIQCLLIGVPYSDGPTNPVLLLIQGLLQPVEGLVFHSDNHCRYIAWCPPFTIEGVPILHYQVTIRNINTTNVIVNTTTNSSILTLCDTLLNDQYSYEMKVAGINELGPGLAATVMKNKVLSLQNHTVSFDMQLNEISLFTESSITSYSKKYHSTTISTTTTVTISTTKTIQYTPAVHAYEEYVIAITAAIILLVLVVVIICIILIVICWSLYKSRKKTNSIPVKTNVCYEDIKTIQSNILHVSQ